MFICSKFFFLFLSLILIVFYTSSTAQSFNFKHYSTNEGLPSSEVYHVFQDSKGYMWFATNFGVSRFDGYKFENFDNKDGLPDNTVLEIYEDFKGRIWFISLSCKLSYFEYEKIHLFKYNEAFLKVLRTRPIPTKTGFYLDKEETVYISLLQQGLYEISKNGIIKNTLYSEIEESSSFWILNKEKKIIPVKNRHSLLNKNKIGVIEDNYRYDIKKLEIKIENAGFPFCIKFMNHYIFTFDNYIVSFSDSTNYNCQKFPYSINWLSIDKHNRIWIGTKSNGVFYYKNSQINPSNYLGNFLRNESISSIFEDNENGIWVTSLGKGVYYFPNIDVYNLTESDGLPDNKINTISFSLDSGILIGGNYNNLVKFKENKISLIEIDKLSNFQVYKIHTNRNKQQTLVGSSKYLYTLKKNNIEICKMDIRKQPRYHHTGIDLLPIKVISNAQDGNYWIANTLGFNKIKKCEIIYDTIITEHFKNRINAIIENTDSSIWLGCDNGLWKYEKKRLINFGEKFSLLKSKITDIKESHEGTLFIGTKGEGLLIFKNNSIVQLNNTNSLLSNSISSIFIEDDFLWTGTNIGLVKISLPAININSRIYTVADGLCSNEINQVYIFGKTVYIGTNAGLSFFEKSKCNKNNTPPPILIKKIKILNKDTLIQKKYKLQYNQNFLTIDFIGLTYKTMGKVNYKYYLEGINSRWEYTTNTSIQYPYLPPGKYKFSVSCQNNNGLWSKKPASIYFEILPPFWKTWWFILLIILCFTGIVFSIYKYRMNEIKTRQKLKDELNRYIQQALTKQMNPHFIFNSLNSIQNYILENDKRQSSKYLTKFARLMRLILENSQNPTITLKQELAAISLYLELEAMRFNGKFSYTINLNELINPEIEIPALLIQPYIENAIWHGIMHKPEQFGIVKIDFITEQNYLLCIITDDGIGRKKSSEINAEKRKNHKSFGTEITEKRLQAYNSLYGTKVGIEYVDLEDENKNPAGTQVKIKIYLKTK